MKKKLLRGVALLLCAVLLAGLLTGCGEKMKASNAISRFEKACHSGDLDSILDCYDPNIVNPIRSVAKLTGLGISTLLDLITPLLGIDLSGVDMKDTNSLLDFLKTLKLKPTAYEFNDAKNKCTVSVHGSIEVLGKERTFDTRFRLVDRDGTWYITV